MIALIGSIDPLTTEVAAALEREGQACVICEMADRTFLDPAQGGPAAFRIEHLGTLLQSLSDWGVTSVCFSGRIIRPRIDPAMIDAATAPLVPRLSEALQRGDDGALRVVIRLFEEAGFPVRPAQEIAPDLLPSAGVMSTAQPTPSQMADATRAERVHRIIAPADVGQGVIVRNGQVLAIEAAPGTDFMLRSVQGLAAGAVFFKAPKLGQDRRADLPVIGPSTLRQAQSSGIAAVVVEAGGVMVVDRKGTIAAADESGLVLWIREPSP
jgi:hypothetical protein